MLWGLKIITIYKLQTKIISVWMGDWVIEMKNARRDDDNSIKSVADGIRL